MWALRRTSNQALRDQGVSIRTFRACFVKSEAAKCYLDEKANDGDSHLATSDKCAYFKRSYRTNHSYPKICLRTCSFSSLADTQSSVTKDDLEDGFSELETPVPYETVDGNADLEDLDELTSDSEDNGDGLELPRNEHQSSDTEADVTQKKSPQKRHSAIFKAIMDSPSLSVQSSLDTWVEEGNEVTRSDVYMAILTLRKRRMYGKALQLSEWLESTKKIEFTDRDYASRLDLIAKVRGLAKAEQYIESVPESFRGEVIYRTLLANYVVASNVKKSEEIFNKMKDLGFPVTSFACNQLLLLYQRLDRKKIADVLLLMEKENVKPTLFTYTLLIDAKGKVNDINGMEQIYETMKAEGIEPNLHTLTILARHYANVGLREKAEAIFKDMERGNLVKNRRACSVLLPLNAQLGKADDVERIWKVCESDPRQEECLAAIQAWGQLKRIEEAEAVFEMMQKKWKLVSKHYSVLLKVYAKNKMLVKGKDLVKRMADDGCRIGPLTWDSLVTLYIEAGDLEKADAVLQKASQQSQDKPMFTSLMAIMEQYSKRGDVHNTEKMFHRMRQAGYTSRIRQFQVLLQAYVNAKTPAYGFRERMKADNVFPNKGVAGLLDRANAFRKTAASELLD